ncbi:hypothetical protein [Spirosoma litoris]
MQLELNSAEKLRANWKYLTPEQIQQLITDGIVSVAIQAAINANADWRVYTGRVDVASYYRAYGENIAPKKDYTTVFLDAQETQNVALFILQSKPEVYAAFLAANDGVALEILPPYVPEPETPPSNEEPA